MANINYQPVWNPEGTISGRAKILHQFDQFVERLNLILPEITPNKKIIDIGCAQGWNSFELNRIKDCNVVGVDEDEECIDIGNNIIEKYKLDSNTISFKTSDVRSFFRDNQDTYYDYCVCFMLLHHFLENKVEVRTLGEPFIMKKKGKELLKQIQSQCKSMFLQVRLHETRQVNQLPADHKDVQLIDYLIDEIGFKSYKILRSNTNNYFRAPNLIYMFK